jgi:hypothetical protein
MTPDSEGRAGLQARLVAATVSAYANATYPLFAAVLIASSVYASVGMRLGVV